MIGLNPRNEVRDVSRMPAPAAADGRPAAALLTISARVFDRLSAARRSRCDRRRGHIAAGDADRRPGNRRAHAVLSIVERPIRLAPGVRGRFDRPRGRRPWPAARDAAPRFPTIFRTSIRHHERRTAGRTRRTGDHKHMCGIAGFVEVSVGRRAVRPSTRAATSSTACARSSVIAVPTTRACSWTTGWRSGCAG